MAMSVLTERQMNPRIHGSQQIELTICNHQADSPLYVWLNV